MDTTLREREWLEGFFLGGFKNKIEDYFYQETMDFSIRGAVTKEPVPFSEKDSLEFVEMRPGMAWGENWECGWFRIEATVPESWRGKEVVARLNFGGEACVFSDDGEPIQGLTGGSVHLVEFVRDLYRLHPRCEGGEKIALWIEAGANELFGIPSGEVLLAPGANPLDVRKGPVGVLKNVQLATFDESMYQLWFDLMVLYRLMTDLPERDVMRARITHALRQARNEFRFDAPNPEAIRSILAPIFQLKASGAEPVIHSVGHAHLDTAWLWPMRESIRKCARSFSTQLGLMDRYPDYVFGASQVPHYIFMKEHYPNLYQRIKDAIAAGRWEVQGALWVECDCNLPSGESLVRQLLYGQRFMREEFGIQVRNAWLPDVFGFPATLPQLFASAGVDSFISQKLSWNKINRFPHHTFNWRGLDGTEVLAHLLPLESYNAQQFPDANRRGARNHEERGYVDRFLNCFGIGDGGGGPSDKHLEFALRQRDLAGCPKVEFGAAQTLIDEFIERSEDFPVWHGPFYLERHQGTLTTHARMKRRNRRIEFALRLSELLWSGQAATLYPRDRLRACWQRLLTNQFHDILPGSSIRRVYEDAHREYDEIEAEIKTLLPEPPVSGAEGGALFNPHGFAIDTVIEVEGLGWRRVCLDGFAGSSIADCTSASTEADGARVAGLVLENQIIRYEFAESGVLTRVFDKTAQREVMRAGESGNVLTLYQDHFSDAWDADAEYREQVIETASVEHRTSGADSGGLAAWLEFSMRTGQSEITQRVVLRSGSKRLDFETRVDWKERNRMLRVAFPVDLRSKMGRTEVQFGLQEWSLHENTSWDRGQQDIPGQRFADISESDYGVALLNDCKYGYRLKERTLDLNLLRGSVYPDTEADQEQHCFTYSLLPHEGALTAGLDVIREGLLLNQAPVRLASLDFELPFQLEAEGVLIDTIKRAEDSDAWVIRVYEPLGGSGMLRLTPRGEGFRLESANLLEVADGDSWKGCGPFEVTLRGFEVRTLLFRAEE